MTQRKHVREIDPAGGTPGQMLRINAAGTELEYADPPAGGGSGGTLGDATWTTPTLLGSWVNYDTTQRDAPGYRKNALGIVMLRGSIKAGAIGTAAFTLPAGYRPAGTTLKPFKTVGDTSNTVVHVEPGGNVVVAAGLNSYVALDGIAFLAANETAQLVGSDGAGVTAPPATGVAVTDTTNLQAAIDAAAAADGVLRIPAGNYQLNIVTGGRCALHIPSGVTVEGSGYATHLQVVGGRDPGRTGYFAIELGDTNTAASNVTIRNLRLTANASTLFAPFGATIEGIGARHDTTLLAHSDNVTVEGCWIYDTSIAVVCSKNTDSSSGDAARLAAQFSNWSVRNNYIDTTDNKAVELQEAMDSEIRANRCVNVVDGPQAITCSRRIKIALNRVDYITTGINVTEAVTDIDVLDNTVRCISATGGEGGIIVRREHFATNTTISRVRIRGNTVIDETSTNRIAFTFLSQAENTGAAFNDVTIEGNTFTGKVYLYDRPRPTSTTGSGLVVRDNDFRSDAYTASGWVAAGTLVARNRFRVAHTVAANDWIYRGNTFDAGYTMTGRRVDFDTGTPVTVRGGGFYLPPGDAAGVQTSTLSNGRIYYVPLYVDKATDIDRLGIEITTAAAAGGVVRLGVYTNANGVPGQLIVGTSAFASTATGFTQIAVDATLPRGLVWLACKAEVADPVLRCHSGRLRPVQWNAGATFTSGAYNAYLETGVAAGALPSTAAPVNSVSTAGPVVLARAA